MSARLREQVAAGVRVRELLEDQTLLDAFDALERRYVAEWRETAAHETEARERAYWALEALDRVRLELKITLDNGSIAASQLEQKQE